MRTLYASMGSNTPSSLFLNALTTKVLRLVLCRALDRPGWRRWREIWLLAGSNLDGLTAAITMSTESLVMAW